jgi:fatty-acyl-CoA synthase
MQGLMMDTPLTLTPFLERARRLYPNKEIVSRAGPELQRTTYGEWAPRVARLASALEKFGVRRGTRVATFAWNDTRHLELYFAIPCMGAVLHPLNLRLAGEDVAFIANHAEDEVLFVDPSLLPAVEKLAPHLKTVRQYVVMAETVPAGVSLSPVVAYEELLRCGAPDYAWPRLDENTAAAMCYTSGTTGHPKGVVYSHRSIHLHTLGISVADGFGMRESDTLMPVVPMFHAMAWGLPFACVMLGTKIVMPGPHLQPRDLAELMQGERVTLTAGVPTLWLGLLGLLETERYDLGALRTLIVGGAAMPQAAIEAFQKKHGLEVVQAWGMTETSPLGTICRLKSHQTALPEAEQFRLRAKQGTPAVGVEIRAMSDDGKEVAWDGQSLGELQVRGPWVVAGYYRDERSAACFDGGWFKTGDVVTIDPEGCIQIADRSKDLIKSGGEWISSVDLENQLMAHPRVLEAAVVAIPHPKWQERPLACVVPRAGQAVTKEELLDHLRPHVARWALPDDVVMIEAIPKTSVGKFDKKALRARFAHHVLPPPSAEPPLAG